MKTSDSERKLYQSVESFYDQRAQEGRDELDVARGIYGKVPDFIKARLERMEDGLTEAAMCTSSGLVLDAGCGNGDILIRMLEKGKHGRFVGMDLSWGMLARAKQRLLGRHAVSGLLQANIVELPFKSYSFGEVCCLEVLVHLPSQRSLVSFLREAHRVLKPGGVLVASMLTNTMSLRGMVTKYALRPFKRDEPDLRTLVSSLWLLKHLRATGFRVEWYRGWDRPIVNRSNLYWLNGLLKPIDLLHERLSGLFPVLHLLRDRIVFRCVKKDPA